MSIKTTLHATAPLLYPCRRYPKCPWGLYASPPYYMGKPGPIAPGEHNKVESKTLHKLGRFPKLRTAGKAFSLFLFFPGSRLSRLRIEISVGRVTKKAYLAFF